MPSLKKQRELIQGPIIYIIILYNNSIEIPLIYHVKCRMHINRKTGSWLLQVTVTLLHTQMQLITICCYRYKTVLI